MQRLPDAPGPRGAEARRFCLDTIKSFYGFDYRADWHADLDSLLGPAARNHFASAHRGAFWLLRDDGGAPVATAGLSHLAWKPGILARFPGRYGEGHGTAFLGRVYVRADRRGQGIGRWLARLAEAEARRLGYPALYLHASAGAAATLRFWHAAGFEPIGTSDNSVHFDKRLAASPEAPSRTLVTAAGN